MTNPITGPYTKDEFLNDIPHWYDGTLGAKVWRRKRKWYRQAKPYDLPLVFDSVTRRGQSRYVSNGPYGDYFGSSMDATAVAPEFPEQQANIYNRAHARFVDAMGAAVELGVATAEGRQALGMVTQRLGQMARFTRNVATGRLGAAAKELGVSWDDKRGRPLRSNRSPNKHTVRPPKDGRETARGFSSTYLEFHFGWSPLLKDIHDALEVLEKPLKPHRIKESATGSFSDPFNFSKVSSDADWNYRSGRDGRYEQTVRLQGDLIIVNPNLAMMQQAGLVNPLSVAWELVPFSFVLDWFVNVGDVLGSLTSFAGVEFLNATRTVFTRYAGTGYDHKLAKNSSVNTALEDWQSNSVHCFRRLGLGTGPTIRLRAPKPWPVARGLAAASLLMQRFPRQVIDENAISLARKRTAFRANVFPQFYGKYF